MAGLTADLATADHHSFVPAVIAIAIWTFVAWFVFGPQPAYPGPPNTPARRSRPHPSTLEYGAELQHLLCLRCCQPESADILATGASIG